MTECSRNTKAGGTGLLWWVSWSSGLPTGLSKLWWNCAALRESSNHSSLLSSLTWNQTCIIRSQGSKSLPYFPPHVSSLTFPLMSLLHKKSYMGVCFSKDPNNPVAETHKFAWQVTSELELLKYETLRPHPRPTISESMEVEFVCLKSSPTDLPVNCSKLLSPQDSRVWGVRCMVTVPCGGKLPTNVEKLDKFVLFWTKRNKLEKWI